MLARNGNPPARLVPLESHARKLRIPVKEKGRFLLCTDMEGPVKHTPIRFTSPCARTSGLPRLLGNGPARRGAHEPTYGSQASRASPTYWNEFMS